MSHLHGTQRPAHYLPHFQDQMASFKNTHNESSRPQHAYHHSPEMLDAFKRAGAIGAKRAMLAVIGENGTTDTFIIDNPNLAQTAIDQFFSPQMFFDLMESASTGLGQPHHPTPCIRYTQQKPGTHLYHFTPSMEGPSPPSAAAASSITPSQAGSPGSKVNSADLAIILNPKNPSNFQRLRIGDEDAIWEYYKKRLESVQQNTCRLLGKLWIKHVEPRKQSSHPYTGGDKAAPEWWPRERNVPHVEPDHLLKEERVCLLAHILRMVINPTHQQAVQKENIDITKLREITEGGLSSFWKDQEKIGQSVKEKRKMLQELFTVANAEARCIKGELDPTTSVFVIPKKGLESFSDDQTEAGAVSDDASLQRGEETVYSSPSPPDTTATMSAASSFSQSLHRAGSDYSAQPPRRSHNAGPYISADMTQDMRTAVSPFSNAHHIGPQTGGMPLSLVVNPHESHSRTHLSNYGEAYPPWPRSIHTHDVSSGYNAYSPGPPLASPPLPMNPHEAFISGSFDRSSGTGYDQNEARISYEHNGHGITYSDQNSSRMYRQPE